MARFDPESYRRYRVDYPPAVFEPLRPLLGPGIGEPRVIADLGAGTGISASSFLRCFPGASRVLLVDPDPEMLKKEDCSKEFPEVRVQTVCTSAEDFRLSSMSGGLDGVLIGSAWHWMDPQAVLQALTLTLKPGGFLAVFEYQFPKASGEGAALRVNEWVRRQFNQAWRASGQVPRGTLDGLLEPVRGHRDFASRGGSSLEQKQALDAEDLEGVIVSQSRYLAYQATLSSTAERATARESLRESLRGLWEHSGRISFEYRFECRVFQRRFL